MTTFAFAGTADEVRAKSLFSDVLLLNEVGYQITESGETTPGSTSPFRLEHAPGGESGYSFGFVQWDLANNIDGPDILRDILLKSEDTEGNLIFAESESLLIDQMIGFFENSKGDVDAIENSSVFGTDEQERTALKQRINNALDSAIGRSTISQAHIEEIDRIFGVVQTAVGRVSGTENLKTKEFLGSTVAQVFLADYDNQLDITLTPGPGKIARFLTGEAVTLGGVDVPAVQVQIRGDSVGLDDLLEFRLAVKDARQSSTGFNDAIRRFTNVVKVANWNTPNNVEEAKGLLGVYRKFIVPQLATLSSDKREAFDKFVVEKASTYLVDRFAFGDERVSNVVVDVPELGQTIDTTTETGPNGQGVSNDLIFGEKQGDTILSGDGDDYLYGGSGADELQGGADDDYLDGGTLDDGSDDDIGDSLIGGTGFDTYIAGNNDEITDSDGQGQVFLGDELVGSALRKHDYPTNEFSSADGQFTLSAIGSELTVTTNPSFLISGYSSGDLGITLFEQEIRDANTNILIAPGGEIDQLITLGGDATDDARIEDKDGIETPIDHDGPGDQVNVVEAGEGNDTILSTEFISKLEVYGGAGNDEILVDRDNVLGDGSSGPVVPPTTDNGSFLFGDAGNDRIEGTQRSDWIDGGADRDIAESHYGDDVVKGGAGDDFLHGGDGNDEILGEEHNDVLTGGAGRDVIRGGSGVDDIWGDATIAASDHNWTVSTVVHPDGSFTRLYSGIDGEFNSLIGQGDILYGGSGGDFIFANGGDDVAYGEHGNDFVEGGPGADRIFGDGGKDSLWGDNSDDGADTSLGEGDTIYGGDDDDGIAGQGGDDRLFGEEGDDLIVGGMGNDRLIGGIGDDELLGGAGDDVLDGGTVGFTTEGEFDPDNESDVDQLEGGGDSDTYVFGRAYGVGIIADESGGADKVLFRSQITPLDVKLRSTAGDLIVELDDGQSDILIISNWLETSSVESLEFANGSVWDTDTILLKLAEAGESTDPGNIPPAANLNLIVDGNTATSRVGTDGNDLFYLNAGSDAALGKGGSDRIMGGTGNDVIWGDELQGFPIAPSLHGNDYIVGGAGSDIALGNGGDDEIFGGDGDDQLSGGNDNDSIYGGAGTDRLFGDDGNDFLSGDEGRDVLQGGTGEDTLLGGWGDDVLAGDDGDDTLTGDGGDDLMFGDAGNDILTGGFGADDLQGGEGDDTLYGSDGDDLIFGEEGDDLLNGGTGKDSLVGGGGNDTYEFGYGDGKDLVVDDAGAADVISLGPDISTSDVRLDRLGDDIFIILLKDRVPTGDTLTLRDWVNSSNTVESIEFSDGSAWDTATIQSLLPDKPTLADGVTSVGGTGDSTFIFTSDASIPDGFNMTLTDLGGTQDSLIFQNSLITTIPPELGSFFFRPSLDGYTQDGSDLVLDVTIVSDVSNHPVRHGQVRISDFYTDSGHIETISFPSGVLNEPNLAPIVNDAVADQTINLDVPYFYQLPSDTFSDGPFDFMRVSATLADGSPLPTWMTFDAETLTFSGTPTTLDSELIEIVVTATDSGVQSSSVDFVLNIGNVNIAPSLATSLDDQSTKADELFDFQVPSSTFADPNPGDVLILSATLSDGSPLPGWLSFDSLTGTFSGTPVDADVGDIDVNVVAMDNGGLTASDEFTLTIKEANVAPVAVPDTASLDVAIDSEFLVNSVTQGTQNSPVLVSLEGGGFVALWAGEDEEPFSVQRFDDAAQKVGGEFTISNVGLFSTPVAGAGLGGGGFVAAWRTIDSEIIAQIVDSSGNPVGSEIAVSETSTGSAHEPDIAVLTGGGFVVTWTDNASSFGDASGFGVLGQRFDSNGNKVGSTFLVNTDTGNSQENARVAALSSGGFIVVWQGEVFVQDSRVISGQRYDAQGNRVGGEMTIGGDSGEFLIDPKVASLSDGGFVVTMATDGFNPLIYAEQYNANGQAVNLDIANSLGSRAQSGTDQHGVMGLADGGYVAYWTTPFGTSTASEIKAQRFDAAGNKSGGEFIANTNVEDFQQRPSGVALQGGSFVLAWDSGDPATGDLHHTGVAARLFSADDPNKLTIDVLGNDTDDDETDDPSNFSLDQVTIRPNGFENPGTVSIEDNKLVYIPGSDVLGLGAGETANIVIDYSMSDDAGESATSTATVIVRGTEQSSDLPLGDIASLDGSGGEISAAGDINGDGFDDVIVSAAYGYGAFIVFGSAERAQGSIDLNSLDGTSGYQITSSVDIRAVSDIGDINKDGFADFMVGLPSPGEGGPDYSGGAIVVYGSASGPGAQLDLDSLDSSQGFSISGTEQFGRTGASVSGAGDVNGDGIDDIVLGAPNNAFGDGEAFVVFGRETGFGTDVDLAALDGTNGFRIRGVPSFGDAGESVSAAGDVNGDGFDDIILTGYYGGFYYEREAYVVFGKGTGFSSNVDLDSLDGSNGYKLVGFSGDYYQLTIDAAGDVNGDGIDDVIIGDYGANNYGGESFVVFGQTGPHGPTFDVSALDGTNGFRLVGSSNEYSGTSVAGAGDVNGDGFDDLLVGAPQRTAYGVYYVGASYLIFGGSDGFSSSIDLNSLDGSSGSRLLGADEYDYSGQAVSAAGDINGDGFDDFLIGAPFSESGGKTFIVYGRDYRNDVELLGTDGSDVIDFLSEDLTLDPIQIFMLGGDDTLNLRGGAFNGVIYSGAGNNAINISPGQNEVVINSGPGDLTVNFGGSTTPPREGGGHSDITIRNSRSGSFTGGLGTVTVIVDDMPDDSSATAYVEGTGYVFQFGSWQQATAWRNRVGSLVLEFNDGQFEVRAMDFDPNDVLGGPRAIERVEFADGTVFTYEDLVARGFDIEGTDSDDALTGTNVTDRILGFEGNDDIDSGDGDDTVDGGSGNDTLSAGDGADVLIGAVGDDFLSGGLGDDSYVISAGDGTDSIDDSGGVDQIVFGAGIALVDIGVSQSGNDLVIGLNSGDSLTIKEWFVDDTQRVERFVFADDQLLLLSDTDMEGLIGGTNQSPEVGTGVGPQSTDEDTPFSFTVPAGAFVDPDVGDNLTLSATLDDGSPLPGWLSFDEVTESFSGTPSNDDVGSAIIKVTATDSGGESVDDTFTLTVANVNDAPIIAAGIDDQTADEDAAFNFTLPIDAFADVDVGDTLTLSASLSDDSALPGWLSFDSVTGTFSGTPINDDVGSIEVKITATDAAAESVADTFTLTVNNINDAPTVAVPLTSQRIAENGAFSYQVPAGTFTDIDVGDNLTISAASAGGGALPGWLSFDSGTATFSGTPPAGSAGDLIIEVTATDSGGLSVTDELPFEILPAGSIVGTSGDDILFGTLGDDVMDGKGGDDAIDGLAGDDRINGGPGHDSLIGGPGNDVLKGEGGNDTLDGGEGDDTLDGGSNMDVLTGGAGNDSLHGGGADDILDGGVGDDTLDGGANADSLTGGVGNDVLLGSGGNDTLDGGEGDDILDGGANADTLTGGPGNDILDGSGGNDTLTGGVGDDTLSGGANADLVDGGDGNDVLTGEGGNDVLIGGDGDDSLDGGANADTLMGGAGNDTLVGGGGNDTLEGGTGMDVLTGDANADVLDGGDDDDVLAGNGGDDTFIGGLGNDLLQGGGNNDTYQFERGDGQDTIEETGGGADSVEYGLDIAKEQLWFTQAGNDLVVRTVGETDTVTIDDWYVSSGNRVEEFRTADGAVLVEAKVQQLVDAMAAFAPPSGTDPNLPQNVEDALEPVFATTWTGGT